MEKKYCHIIPVGHHSNKIFLTVDRERHDKIILITEKEPMSGTSETLETLNEAINYYQERKTQVVNIQFNFNVQTKPISELVHLIYQQKLLGYENITINISTSLRYINVWFYIAASLTESRLIHADYIYEEKVEVGINKNDELILIPFFTITEKQFEFLELFFPEYNSYRDFFVINASFDENSILNKRIKYDSLENLKIALIQKRKKDNLTRGSVNGFIQKLNKLSALTMYPNPNDKKEKTIEISYLGIAYFLQYLYENKRIDLRK